MCEIYSPNELQNSFYDVFHKKVNILDIFGDIKKRQNTLSYKIQKLLYVRCFNTICLRGHFYEIRSHT